MIRRASALILVLLASPAVGHTQADEDDARERASAHFDRGIVFYDEERYDAALAELAAAYELAPAHQTLYNLARVHAALGQAVEAAASYARYLEEGGDALSARRRREAEAALAQQRGRIGHVRVTANVDGATVAIDGVDVARTPLAAPIALSAGAHIVELRAPNHDTVRRAVAVAGQSETRLEFELREAIVQRGNLRVATSLEDVVIAVDGEVVGATPLGSTIPLRAGVHEVSARRAGYRPETRRVEIAAGAEVEIRFDLRRATDASPEHLGRIRLELPDAPYLVRVDGELTIGVDIEVPIGAHQLRIEVTGRQPYEGTIRVGPREALEITPPLWWTLEERRDRLDGANAQRSTGIALSSVGAALVLAGLATVIWNEAEISTTDTRLVFINEALDECRRMGFDCPMCDDFLDEGETIAARQDTQNVLRGISIAGTVLGAMLGTIGAILWTSAPSEQAVDAEARAELRVGPSGLVLRGWF